MTTGCQGVMMTGDRGVAQMMTGSPGEMMTGVRGVAVMIQGQVLGDHLVNQGDGENEKRLVRTAGGLPETPDLQETANGIETKIVMKTRKTGNLTEIEILIETIVSGVPGMMLVGEEDQLRKLLAGEIQVAVKNGTEVVVT
ncbi:PREDICTED: uncharacterized protein LOC104353901 [Leptosomus discolor]|uniref:uncharacterized protein LOC104353901 n=1 Tax=Leptosomus discolor TaxID=188344 RepID=UPI0005229A65|nr:PREDICTED: uncharacterized protein LOC104353901 [Leptosomus discolor]